MQEVMDATVELYDTFLNVDCAAALNLQRVQAAMAEENVGPHHFSGSTGYGHGDLGRAAYDQVRLSLRQFEPFLTQKHYHLVGECYSFACP